MSGVAQANISRIEAGETTNPRPSTMRRLAAAMGVAVEELWTDDGKTNDPGRS